MEKVNPPRIGILNDLHYDGSEKASTRLYASVDQLNREQADWLIVMGDLIDADSETNAERLLREVAARCNAFRGSVRYMLGNHDLDHLSKPLFFQALGCSGTEPTFSQPEKGVTLMGIDGNFSPDGTEYDHGNFNWREAFVPNKQLTWLEEQLTAAQHPVILFSHQRIDVPGEHSVSNHASVREIIRRSGKVKAVFQGHRHADDLQQIDGTTYYTLGAHKNKTGSTIIHATPQGIQVDCDFQPQEPA